MIENRQLRIPRSQAADPASLIEAVRKTAGVSVLRWYVGQTTPEDLIIEATVTDEPMPPGALEATATAPATPGFYPGRSAAISIVPTGIGCSLGGFAGDAAPATHLLASTVDYLITHPNAVNASDFVALDRNVLYTEGYMIDLLCHGLVDLFIPYSNRVGLIVEKSEPARLELIYNVVNAVRAVHGVDVEHVIVTPETIGSRCEENASGAFVGSVDRPQVLLDACEELLRRGVDAIAVTTNVQDLPLGNYAKHFAGEYPNPVGGVEAIISHLIVRNFRVPAAHAPLLNIKNLELQHPVVDARGAGEFASASGLACVLIGLQRAPRLERGRPGAIADAINRNNVLAMVCPASCLGGLPVFDASLAGIPIIAVRENTTILEVNAPSLPLAGVVEAASYAEAAGILLALRQGISLASVSRPLLTLR